MVVKFFNWDLFLIIEKLDTYSIEQQSQILLTWFGFKTSLHENLVKN